MSIVLESWEREREKESCTSILLTSVFRASNGLISSWMSSIAPLLIELHVLSLRVLTRPPPWWCVIGCICVSNIWYCITCTVLCYILSGCICVSNIWYCITCTVLCYILFLHLSTNCSTYFYGDVLNASLVLLRSRLPGILMKLIQVWSVFFVLVHVGTQTR